jgi:hypothetical protein
VRNNNAYCLRKGNVDIIKNEHPSTSSGRQQTEITVWRWRDITGAAGQPLRDLGGRIMEQHVAEIQTRRETEAKYQQRCIFSMNAGLPLCGQIWLNVLNRGRLEAPVLVGV